MLYRIFKLLFYLTVKGYFRSTFIEGKEQVPVSGPLIFVANHTSAFMDPILLAVHLKRPVYFLARGESFKSKLVSTIFSWLHMIPIYRPDISPDEVHKNKQVFQRCFDHLAEGKTIMIFPEGISKTERRLRPIKTGVARIALGAEQEYGFGLGVKIIPIGINYSNPHYFQSDVYVRFGQPIELEQFHVNYEADSVKAVKDLTAMIKSQLERLTVIVEDESLDQLIKDIERLYRSTLRAGLPEKHKAAQDFYLSKEIVSAVQFYKAFRPKSTLEFQRKIANYIAELDRLEISDAEIRSRKAYARSIRKGLYFILGFPFFVYGYLVNISPYFLAMMLSRRITVRKDFIGSMKLALGMFIFLIFYSVQIFIVSIFTHWYWVILFALSLYPSGLFTLNYIKQYYRWKGHRTFERLYKKKKKVILNLKARREALLIELENGRQMYLRMKAGSTP